jgi:hypothetical protein
MSQQFQGLTVVDLIQMVDRHLAEATRCQFEEPESRWGACDGGQRFCQNRAISAEVPFCETHFAIIGEV